MSFFRQSFRNSRVVLPVVHVTSLEQARRNVTIASDAEADGVFLINHAMRWQELLSIHDQLARERTNVWIGVNCLDLDPADVFAAVGDRIQGVWVDNAEIVETSSRQEAADEIRSAQGHHDWKGLYFGGVAFKYQGEVADLRAACRAAAPYMDVVTTSGPGTGRPASVEKIRVMKEALGDHPLAIASGITPDNVADYLPFADCFLVATGISDAFDEFDPKKVRALVDRVRAFEE